MRLKIASDKIQMFSYFAGLCFLGSVALYFPFAYLQNRSVSYLDALFTSVSAVCVTGLTVIDMNRYSTFGLICIMLLIELGGMGVISFIAIAVAVPKRRVSLVNRMVIRDFFVDEVESEPRRIVRAIVLLTIVIESFASIFLFIGFRQAGSRRPVLDAVFHSVSAFCNAGFSTYQNSLIQFRFNYLVIIPILFLIVTGGIGFLVMTDLAGFFMNRSRKISFHSRFVLLFTSLLIAISALVFFVTESDYSYAGFPLSNKILSAIFQGVTPRTAGFEIVPQASYSLFSQLFTMILMFIGGSPGSIAGGIKTTTFFIVLIYALRGNVEKNGLNVLGRNIDTALVDKSFTIFSKSLLIILLSIGALLVTEAGHVAAGKYSVFALMYESISAFGTVGLSLGVTSELTSWGKIVIIATMFIGRTGIVAMALGFSSTQKDRFVDYPSANVIVG